MTELEYLLNKHKKLHDTVEALEAEKAPENTIRNAKAQKLAVKTLIAKLTNANGE